MSTLNLHHLRLFRATAREGTLTAAAKALNISQSAVSTQIKALEADLGHDLFERRGRNLVLTEAGRIALDYADQIFLASDQLMATFRAVGGQRKVLRIGALATLSRNFQMRFLAPLIGRDDVEVVLRSGTQPSLLRALEAMSIDVLLTNLVPARDAASPYLVRRLDEQPVSLVGARSRLALAAQGLTRLLTTVPLILPTPETALRAGFAQLSGNDETALAFNAMGGVGCISVAANVAPKLCAQFQAAWAEGNTAIALALHDRLFDLHQAMFSDTSPGPVKYALSRVHDWFSPEVRLPIIPANDASRAAVDAALSAAGVI